MPQKQEQNSQIADPMDALRGLQSALETGIVDLRSCELQPEIQVLLDHPNGKTRFTYARIGGNGVVEAIALFVLTDAINEIPCFQIGYAVFESMRGNGLGARTLQQAIAELAHGLCRARIKEFYLEAIISPVNVASSKIAKRLIAETPELRNDDVSGEPVLRYLRKVQCSGA